MTEKISPVLLYPVFGILIVGLVMTFVVEPPIGALNTALMQKPASEALKEKIEQVNENVRILYDMTFTAYQKTVPVDAVAVSGTQVIGYVSSEKADLSFGEEHIREILKNNKCKSVGVKLFREEKRFLDQLKQMNQKQSEHETTGSRKAEYICDVLRAIVL